MLIDNIISSLRQIPPEAVCGTANGYAALLPDSFPGITKNRATRVGEKEAGYSRSEDTHALRLKSELFDLRAGSELAHLHSKCLVRSWSFPDITKNRATRTRFFVMVGEAGFGPAKSVTTDLQSAPFGRSGIPP